jgi:hypothetical protein
MKPTILELTTAIGDLFSSGVFPSPFELRRNADHAAYEAYVFTLVLRAVEQAGGTVEIRSILSPATLPGTFIFRGGPGDIYSTRYDYGYALCSYGDQEFEIHLDVEYRGNSRVSHEIDVSIVDRQEAERCRRTGSQRKPTARKTRGAIECKFYERLDTALIRAFVGLMDDMGDLKVSLFASNTTSATLDLYCRRKSKRPTFVGNLVPNSVAEQEFIDAIADGLRNWPG